LNLKALVWASIPIDERAGFKRWLYSNSPGDSFRYLWDNKNDAQMMEWDRKIQIEKEREPRNEELITKMRKNRAKHAVKIVERFKLHGELVEREAVVLPSDTPEGSDDEAEAEASHAREMAILQARMSALITEEERRKAKMVEGEASEMDVDPDAPEVGEDAPKKSPKKSPKKRSKKRE
jgi:hypothetical protein